MGELKPEKINISEINGGQEYKDDNSISAELINRLVNSSAFVQSLIETEPSVSNENPNLPSSVSILKGENGYRFHFENIKGRTGENGVGGAVLSNNFGNSNVNGYTQQAVNNLIYNPNLLINGDFKINQRRANTYSTNNKYCVDRWRVVQENPSASGELSIVGQTYGGIRISNGTNASGEPVYWAGLVQWIDVEQSRRMVNKKVTLSLSVKASSGTYTFKETFTASTTLPMLNEKKLNSPFPSIWLAKISVKYSSSKFFVLFKTGNDADAKQGIVLNWIKLEYGSVATPFLPTHAEEELLMCQRYYQRWDFVPDTPLPVGIGNNDDLPNIIIPFSITPMRQYRTFSTNGTVKLLNEGVKDLTLMYNKLNDKLLSLKIDTDEEEYVVEQGKPYLIAGASNGYFAIDAEIYDGLPT